MAGGRCFNDDAPHYRPKRSHESPLPFRRLLSRGTDHELTILELVCWIMIASPVISTCPVSKRRGVLLLFSLAALVATPAWAQTQLGTLFGTVTDTSGAVVPGAEVSVENVTTGLKRDGRTDKTGEYQLVGLPTGRYTLRVQKEGFQIEVREGIPLSPGAAIGINLSLVVGELSAHVTVEAGGS